MWGRADPARPGGQGGWQLAEVRAGVLAGGPGAVAPLPVVVVKASRVRELAGGVPVQVRVAGLHLSEGQAAQPAELPVRAEADLVKQADIARRADPVPDLTECRTLADDRELEGLHLQVAPPDAAAAGRLRVLDSEPPGVAGCLIQPPGVFGVKVSDRDRTPFRYIDAGLIQSGGQAFPPRPGELRRPSVRAFLLSYGHLERLSHQRLDSSPAHATVDQLCHWQPRHGCVPGHRTGHIAQPVESPVLSYRQPAIVGQRIPQQLARQHARTVARTLHKTKWPVPVAKEPCRVFPPDKRVRCCWRPAA